MKEVIIIAIVILLVVISGAFMGRYLEKSSNELISVLEQIRANINNFEENERLVEDVLKRWDKINNVWSTIIIHDELDKIELSMLGLKGAILSKTESDVTEEIERTIFLVNHIKEKEAFKLKNIF